MGKKTTFVFCAPIANTDQSNGILSILTLARELEALGCDVYFFSILSEYPSEENLLTINQEWRWGRGPWKALLKRTFAAAERLGVKLLMDRDDPRIKGAYIIYPDRILHNPLDAPNVIRYFGNKNGVLNGGVMVEENPRDFILVHSRALHANPHFVLFFAHINPAFHDADCAPFEKREKSLTYVGKGSLYAEVGILLGTEQLPRNEPATKEGLAALLRNTRFLFSWDTWSNIWVEAIYCGAIPVLLTPIPFTEEELDKSELGPLPRISMQRLKFSDTGAIEMVYPEDLVKFQEDRISLMKRVEKYNAAYQGNIKLFMEAVIAHFAKNPAPEDSSVPFPSILQTTEQALRMATTGELPIPYLIYAAQRLLRSNHRDIALQLYRLWAERAEETVVPEARLSIGVMLFVPDTEDDTVPPPAPIALRSPEPLPPGMDAGRVEQAIAAWQGILGCVNQKSASDRVIYIEALNNLSRLLALKQDLSESVRILELSLHSNPNQPDVAARREAIRQKLVESPE